MTTEQLTPLDMAFLCLERESTPMHMGAVTVFQPSAPPDLAALVALLGERAARIPQLRRKVHRSWFGTCFWVDDPRFDPGEHIRTHEMTTPGGTDELADLVSRLTAEPLDVDRPLWELHVITGLEGGRFAVLAKLHHALCDGAGAIAIGAGLMDGFELAAAPEEPRDLAEVPSPVDAARTAWGLLSHPDRLVGKVSAVAGKIPETIRGAGQSFDIATAVARSARVPAADSPMLAQPSGNRHVELLRLDLADVRRARKLHGGTVNDMLLTVVTGALRRWLTSRGYAIDDLAVRALIPVSQRARNSSAPGGNKLSGLLCDLPVGEPDPSARAQRIQESMYRNKTSDPHRGAGAIPLLAEQLPHAAHRFAMPVAGLGAPLLFDTVITNVPLPRTTFSLAGARMQEMYPLVPLAPGHAMAVAISRYGDTVHIGLQVNGDALPDVAKLSEAVPSALRELTDTTAPATPPETAGPPGTES